MSRFVNVAIGQLCPISRSARPAPRSCSALRADARGAPHGLRPDRLPELALTTFFRAGSWKTPPKSTSFRARDAGPRRSCSTSSCTLGSASYIGYAELAVETASPPLTQHLDPGRPAPSSAITAGAPAGHWDHEPGASSSTWRSATSGRATTPGVRGLRRRLRHGHLQRPALDRNLPRDGRAGVEMILIGYNTPVHNPPAPGARRSRCSTTSW